MAFSAIQLICSVALLIPIIYLLSGYSFQSKAIATEKTETDIQKPFEEQIRDTQKSKSEDKQEKKSIMQAENPDLQPPKDDLFTLDQLKQYDGSNPEKPIYVAIKGTIFDVTRKADMYGPGKSYNIFAGKDGSKGLGQSSLKEEDAVPDYSDLNEADMATLNHWYDFFSKRYNVMGRVATGSANGANL